eukprot:tig00000361_g24404.t1
MASGSSGFALLQGRPSNAASSFNVSVAGGSSTDEASQRGPLSKSRAGRPSSLSGFSIGIRPSDAPDVRAVGGDAAASTAVEAPAPAPNGNGRPRHGSLSGSKEGPHAASAGGMNFKLRPMHLLTISPRFEDDATEAAYAAHRSAVVLSHLRPVLPLMFCCFVGLAGLGFFAMALPSGWERAYRNPHLAERMMKVAIGNAPGILTGTGVLILAYRYPKLFGKHLIHLLQFSATVTAGSTFLSTIDFVHPQMVFFPVAWGLDLGYRGLFGLTPYGCLSVLGVMLVLVWTVYPSIGIVTEFSEYYGMVILATAVVPISIIVTREEDLRRRNEFARHRRDAAEREGLLQQNAGLQDMLRSLQVKGEEGKGVDLNSPLTKAVDTLVALRCDPRLASLCEWAPAMIDDAVSHLLASGSIVLPDFSQQVREGTLQLDRDVGRWLFSEIVPGQQEAAGDFGAGSAHGSARGRGPGPGPGPSGGGGGGAGSDTGAVTDLGGAPSAAPSGAGRDTPGPFAAVAVGGGVRSSKVLAPEPVPYPLADAVEGEALRLASLLPHWEEGDLRVVDAATGGAPLLAVCMAAARESGLLQRLGVPPDKFAAFISAVEGGYQANPYHNRAHAADVTRSMAFLLTGGGLSAHLSDVDRLAAIVACAVHDYEHPGYNNNFLCATSAPLAILYNDRSPLESHHVAGSWKLLRNSAYDFLSALPKAARKELRRTVIDMVLATDMARHFEILGNFRKRAAAGFLPPGAEQTAQQRMKAAQAREGPDSHRSGGVSGAGAGPSPNARRGSDSSNGGGRNWPTPPPPHAPSSELLPPSPMGRTGGGRGTPDLPDRAPLGRSGLLARQGSFVRDVREGRARPMAELPEPVPENEAPPLPPFNQLQAEDRRLILAVAIKACDIGHAAKPRVLHTAWSKAIQEEFFAQGDREKALGLDVSPFMDRSVSNFPKSQIGFLDFVALPLFKSFASVFPAARAIVDHASANYAHWQREAEAMRVAAEQPAAPQPRVKPFLAEPESPAPRAGPAAPSPQP